MTTQQNTFSQTRRWLKELKDALQVREKPNQQIVYNTYFVVQDGWVIADLNPFSYCQEKLLQKMEATLKKNGFRMCSYGGLFDVVWVYHPTLL
jgi:hypothetical protein